jgi:hypothetical protein
MLVSMISMLLLASPAPAPSPWAELAPLLGEWQAEGSGQPGASGGTFSFTPDLDRAVVTRRAHSEYPATKSRPAFAHDDLMVIFHEGDATRAIYFDNEGHTIRYAVHAEAKKVVFLSESAPGPRFRLTYEWSSDGVLNVAFEIAPPGDGPFKTYVRGTAKLKP